MCRFLSLPEFALPILLTVFLRVPSLRGHLQHGRGEHPAARLWAVLMEPNHQMAFVFMAALTCAGMTIFTNLATYMEFNVGLSNKQLPLIYLTGGICTVFSMNWIGRWADRAGKLRVFTLMSLSAAVPIIARDQSAARAAGRRAGHLHPAHDLHVRPVRSGDGDDDGHGGIALPGRFHERQFVRATIFLRSGGVGERVIVGQGPNKEITHFSMVGMVSLACVFSCIWLARFLKPAARDLPGAPIFVEPV